jgi:hypothetical protein
MARRHVSTGPQEGVHGVDREINFGPHPPFEVAIVIAFIREGSSI